MISGVDVLPMDVSIAKKSNNVMASSESLGSSTSAPSPSLFFAILSFRNDDYHLI